jgi:hypothetical protein
MIFTVCLSSWGTHLRGALVHARCENLLSTENPMTWHTEQPKGHNRARWRW